MTLFVQTPISYNGMELTDRQEMTEAKRTYKNRHTRHDRSY